MASPSPSERQEQPSPEVLGADQAPRRVMGRIDGPIEPGSFLEKRSYRRRRLTDGLRLLPILGLWLFMVPLLWPGAAARLTDTGVSMSSALLYIFCVWCVLIALCAFLSRGQDGTTLPRPVGPPQAPPEQEDLR